MKRFIIHLHHAKRARTHFDLRLENDRGGFDSWAVPKARLPESGEKFLAIQVEEHSPDIYNFKGTIEMGYGAGVLDVFDRGKYLSIDRKSDRIKFKLMGSKAHGTFVLFNFGGKHWFFMRSSQESGPTATEV